ARTLAPCPPRLCVPSAGGLRHWEAAVPGLRAVRRQHAPDAGPDRPPRPRAEDSAGASAPRRAGGERLQLCRPERVLLRPHADQPRHGAEHGLRRAAFGPPRSGHQPSLCRGLSAWSLHRRQRRPGGSLFLVPPRLLLRGPRPRPSGRDRAAPGL
ncbi:MAG: GH23, partial [uncultured Rubellimicrobium sp.]